jgi:hypothetical protein
MGLRGIIAPIKRAAPCNHLSGGFVEPVVNIVGDISPTLSLTPEAGIGGPWFDLGETNHCHPFATAAEDASSSMIMIPHG